MTKLSSLPPHHEKIQKHAEWYVSRYAPSSPSFQNHILLWMKKKQLYPSDHHDIHNTLLFIQHLSQKYIDYGFINDHEFILTRIKKWSRKGWSHTLISQKLKSQGLNPQLIENTLLSSHNLPNPHDHVLSLLALKKLTPHSSPDTHQKNKQRALAFIARRGFSHADAIDILKNLGF